MNTSLILTFSGRHAISVRRLGMCVVKGDWGALQRGIRAAPKGSRLQADPAAVKARREAVVGAAPKAGKCGPTISMDVSSQDGILTP